MTAYANLDIGLALLGFALFWIGYTVGQAGGKSQERRRRASRVIHDSTRKPW